MTVPAPRSDDAGVELAHLRDLYGQLPPKSVRWKTDAGRDFLLALDTAVSVHGARSVAEALRISTQAVYGMRDLTIPARPRTWPRQEDLRALRSAWRPVEATVGHQHAIPRISPEYRAVHNALADLLRRGFELRDIARAMRQRTRRLRRFLEPPLVPPEIAHEVRQALSQTDAPSSSSRRQV